MLFRKILQKIAWPVNTNIGVIIYPCPGDVFYPIPSTIPAGNDVNRAGLRVLPADDRFDDPDLADGGGQFCKSLGVEVFPGLCRIGLKLGQRDGVELLGCIGCHAKVPPS